MKTINIRPRFALSFVAAALSLALTACGADSGNEQTVPSSQQLKNLCKETAAWCAHPWISAETQSCYCLCDWHDDCADSPEPSECGVLLNDQGLAAFPDGDPFVCRLKSDATKTP